RERDAESQRPRRLAERERRNQDDRAEEDEPEEACGRERRAPVEQALDQVAVERAEQDPDGQARPDHEVTRQGNSGSGDDREDRAADHCLPQQTAGRHFVNSLTFTQMLVAPAARPTTRPTRTKTGAVWNTLSRATPPSSGKRTQAAK